MSGSPRTLKSACGVRSGCRISRNARALSHDKYGANTARPMILIPTRGKSGRRRIKKDRGKGGRARAVELAGAEKPALVRSPSSASCASAASSSSSGSSRSSSGSESAEDLGSPASSASSAAQEADR